MRRTILLTLVAMCAACTPENPVTTPPPRPIRVTATTVRRGPIRVAMSVSGETAAFTTLRLASPVAGRVTTVAVWPGDAVQSGQVVARVLPVENEATLQGFKILQDAGVLTSEERHRGRRLARDLRRNDIALRAPFAGVVADRLNNPDEHVAANDVLLEIFDPTSLHVLAQLPVRASVAAGMSAEIVIAGGDPVPGHVVALLPAVAPQALTIPVRIALDEPLSRPLLHAPVQCSITTTRHDRALLIPARALLTTAASDTGSLMIVVGEHAEQRTVRVGLRSEDLVEVTDGVAEGDVVLVDGHYGLPPGAPVSVHMMPAD